MFAETLAFFNGLMASISPCTFPMYPIIFAYFFMDNDTLSKKKVAMFIGGYVASMLILSLVLFSFSGISIITETLKFAGAGFMIIFGAFMLAKREFKINVKKDMVKNPFLFGMLFAFMINPCSFPFLLSTLTLSISNPSGYLFILLYGLGLIIPPTLFGILGKSVVGKVKRIYPKWGLINAATGIILIIAGVITAYSTNITHYSLWISSGLLFALVILIVYFGFQNLGRKMKAIKLFQMAIIGGFWAVFTFRCSEIVSMKTTGAMCHMTCDICSTCVFSLSGLAVASIISILITEKYLAGR